VLQKIVIHCYYKSDRQYFDKNLLVQEYITNEKSASQIAKENNCSHSTILKHLALAGIKIRGRVVDDIEEQVVIKKIKLLRAAGNSYWKIADVLNRNEVLTKKRGI